MKAISKLTVKVNIKLSFWTAIKLRIIGTTLKMLQEDLSELKTILNDFELDVTTRRE